MFNQRELDVLKSAFQNAYEAIGADLQAARETCGESGGITREELFEVIQDTGALRTNGTWNDESRTVVEAFLALPYKERLEKYMKKVLPFESYE